VRFWDSSAIVPLLCTESETHAMLELYGADPSMLVWALTRTEIVSALCRRHREGAIARRELSEAKTRLKQLESDWTENSDYRSVQERAERLLELHPLSAADALQLAGALVAVEERTSGFGFITLDARLGEAAAREGFDVVGAVP
jgi:predicted nucleic acid-binding protein